MKGRTAMISRSSIVLVAASMVMLAESSAWAQRWGRAGFPRDGVCFFKDSNFRGDSFCVRTGDELRTLPRGMDDEISSIRVFGRAEVFVFRGEEFEGRSERFNGDIRNLKEEGWNDRISSIRVRRAGGFVGNRPPIGRPNEDPDRIVR